MAKARYDKQGSLFHHLAKVAGWSQKRINALLLKRFKASHWMALNEDQKNAAIAMMRNYAEQGRAAQAKKLRQRIAIEAKKRGYDMDWIHDKMEGYGCGRSMRALDYTELVELKNRFQAEEWK